VTGAADKAMQAAQQLNEQLKRTFRVPETSAEITPFTVQQRAGKIPGFDSVGALKMYEPEIPILPAGASYDVATIAAMKALAIADIPNGKQIMVSGYYAAGDGGGGVFYFNAVSSAADNGGTIIAPSAGSGRWIRVYSGTLKSKQFGLVGDGSTNNTTALTACLAAMVSGDNLVFSDGTYLTDPITIATDSISLESENEFGAVLRQRVNTNKTIFSVTSDHVKFQGLGFDGNASTPGGISNGMVRFIGTTGGIISNCLFQNSGGEGVTFETSTNYKVYNSTFSSCYRGLYGNTQNITTAEYVSIHDNVFKNIGQIRSFSVNSLTRSSSTATATTSTAHGFTSGEFVRISGASPSGYNLTAAVTVTGSTTFTYTVDSTLSTPASGTITAEGITGNALQIAATETAPLKNFSIAFNQFNSPNCAQLIDLYRGSNCGAVIGNQLIGSAWGMSLGYGRYVTISSNSFINNETYGLEIVEGSSNITVSGNVIDGGGLCGTLCAIIGTSPYSPFGGCENVQLTNNIIKNGGPSSIGVYFLGSKSVSVSGGVISAVNTAFLVQNALNDIKLAGVNISITAGIAVATLLNTSTDLLRFEMCECTITGTADRGINVFVSGGYKVRGMKVKNNTLLGFVASLGGAPFSYDDVTFAQFSGNQSSNATDSTKCFELGSYAIATDLTASPHYPNIVVDATSAARTITLPDAITNQGLRLRIQKSDGSGNAVTVTRAGSDTINTGTSYALSSQFAYVVLEAAGTNWHPVANS
jgi:hypothetical protein